MSTIPESVEVVVIDPPAAPAPSMALAPAAPQVAINPYEPLTVAAVVSQVTTIQHVMKAVMREGEHFGIVPGTSRKDKDGNETAKPTLYKAGAEKLTLTFRLAPRYRITRHMLADGHMDVDVTCDLYSVMTGQFMGSGAAMRSTREEKYAFRKGGRACPACGVTDSIIKGKPEYAPKMGGEVVPGYEEGGWLCYKKKGGCGAAFQDADGAIVSQQVERVPNPNIADTYNTVVKMACKSALVAAVLVVCAASDIFTQDLEDIIAGGEDGPKAAAAAPKPAPAPARAAAPTNTAPPTRAPGAAAPTPTAPAATGGGGGTVKMASDKQVHAIRTLICKKHGVAYKDDAGADRVLENIRKMDGPRLWEIPMGEASEIIKELNGMPDVAAPAPAVAAPPAPDPGASTQDGGDDDLPFDEAPSPATAGGRPLEAEDMLLRPGCPNFESFARFNAAAAKLDLIYGDGFIVLSQGWRRQLDARQRGEALVGTSPPIDVWDLFCERPSEAARWLRAFEAALHMDESRLRLEQEAEDEMREGAR